MAEKKNDKDGALQEALKMIQKQYGQGSIMKLGERASVTVDAISSGSLVLDKALGIGDGWTVSGLSIR